MEIGPHVLQQNVCRCRLEGIWGSEFEVWVQRLVFGISGLGYTGSESGFWVRA